MEPREPRLTQQPVEDMSHLMEECHNIIVSHEGGLVGCRLRKVGNHGCQWIAARAVRLLVAG